MIITYEVVDGLSLIYLSFKDTAGVRTSMIHDISCKALIDQNENWVGIEIFNFNGAGHIVDLPIPIQNGGKSKELITTVGKGFKILFDWNTVVCDRLEMECNIDIGDKGLFGIEIMVRNFPLQLDIVKEYIR